MSAYFQLIPIGSTTPAKLHEVDAAMAAHFDEPVDPDRWFREWYHVVGLGLALGHSWDRLRELLPNQAPIVDWLEANYTVDTWYGR